MKRVSKSAAVKSGKGKAPARDKAALRLDGEINIYRAGEIRQTLLDALAAGPELAIDLSGVSEIDTSGVQLLMAAKRSADAAGKPMRLVEFSPAVQEVLALFDLAPYFEVNAEARSA